jgi:hypothetical protein
MDSSWGRVTCSIYDNFHNRIARPLFHNVLPYGNSSVDVTGIECSFGTAEVYAWRPDGAVSNTAIIEYNNPLDSIEWSRIYGHPALGDGASSVWHTLDSGYVFAGSYGTTGPSSFTLIKADKYGMIHWNKQYARSGISQGVANEVQQTDDGGYILAGYATKAFSRGHVLYIVKTNSVGDTLWTRTYAAPDCYFTYAHSVCQTSDGGYIVSGYSAPASGDLKALLLKYDNAGNLIWNSEYGPPGGSAWANSVRQTSDGGYIFTGYCNPPTLGSVYLVKTDEFGDTLWTKTYESNAVGEEIEQTVDGGYIITGTKGGHAYLLKVDSQGNMDWDQPFQDIAYSSCYSVKQTFDGGYIIAGEIDTTTYKTGEEYPMNSHNVLLAKTNRCGDTTWIMNFGYVLYDCARSVHQTVDGGFIIAGTSMLPHGDNSDMYFIKIGPQPTYPEFKCGDANSDCDINVLDTSYLIDFLYMQGPQPEPLAAGDANGDGTVNVFDVTYIVSYLYMTGPAPVCPTLD